MKLICGLGNPGGKYNNTRHNVGFMVVDALVGEAEFNEKWNALVAEIEINGEKTYVIKPTTFMNLSGQAVAKFANFYKIESENITIVYDDIDLPLGTLRSRESGGPGTHNGMKSIIADLGTQNFPRLRVGIESRGETAPEQMDLAAFVLAPFSKEEALTIDEAVTAAVVILKKPLA
jgi:peptidyl-tRNA hydrolase, PTH1 family